MKSSIYQLLLSVFELILNIVQGALNFVLELISRLFNGLYFVLASLFKAVLWLIDKDRVYHAEQVMQQEDINAELQILLHTTKVKEDALGRGAWTSEHSIAINELSQQLYDECEWSKERIHTYMRAIVESIPGLQYVAGDDDDDYDDDSIEIGG